MNVKQRHFDRNCQDVALLVAENRVVIVNHADKSKVFDGRTSDYFSSHIVRQGNSANVLVSDFVDVYQALWVEPKIHTVSPPFCFNVRFTLFI